MSIFLWRLILILHTLESFTAEKLFAVLEIVVTHINKIEGLLISAINVVTPKPLAVFSVHLDRTITAGGCVLLKMLENL